MSRKLLRQLANCDLKMAAFDLVKRLQGRGYPTNVVAALELFTKLPCPETAVNLIAVCPDPDRFVMYGAMIAARDFFARTIPEQFRGPALQGVQEWMESFERNLRVTADIQSFLLKAAASGRVRVGFHSMRDQSVLYQRLRQIGMKKGIFANGRQFLRNRITKQLPAFRAVNDLICVHGVHDGRERFWNGLGAEGDSQLYLQSEVLYEITEAAHAFCDMLRDRQSQDQPHD